VSASASSGPSPAYPPLVAWSNGLRTSGSMSVTFCAGPSPSKPPLTALSNILRRSGSSYAALHRNTVPIVCWPPAGTFAFVLSSLCLALSDHFGVRLRMERTCASVTFVLIAWAAFSAVLENDVVAILLLYVQVPEPLHVVDALDGSVRTGACLLVVVTVVTPMRSGPTSCAGQDMTASPGGVLNVQLFCKKLTAHIVASGKKRTEIAIIEAV
jgi:hypothetical protein